MKVGNRRAISKCLSINASIRSLLRISDHSDSILTLLDLLDLPPQYFCQKYHSTIRRGQMLMLPRPDGPLSFQNGEVLEPQAIEGEFDGVPAEEQHHMLAGNVTRSFPAEDRLLIDASALIAYLDGRERASLLAIQIIDDFVRSGRNAATVSMISVMEVLIRPLRSGAPSLIVTWWTFSRVFLIYRRSLWASWWPRKPRR